MEPGKKRVVEEGAKSFLRGYRLVACRGRWVESDVVLEEELELLGEVAWNALDPRDLYETWIREG